MSKKIYVVCSVRNADPKEVEQVEAYVKKLEEEGHEVHYPPRDVDQECETGVSIVEAHRKAMLASSEVHVFWNVESSGSHFDIGMAVALGKKIIGVNAVHEDGEGKSYWKVIKHYEEEASEERPLSIVEIINKVGIDNIKVQSIHQSLHEIKVMRNKDTRITFYTEPVEDIMDIRTGKKCGLVVWFDRDLFDE